MKLHSRFLPKNGIFSSLTKNKTKQIEEEEEEKLVLSRYVRHDWSDDDGVVVDAREHTLVAILSNVFFYLGGKNNSFLLRDVLFWRSHDESADEKARHSGRERFFRVVVVGVDREVRRCEFPTHSSEVECD